MVIEVRRERGVEVFKRGSAATFKWSCRGYAPISHEGFANFDTFCESIAFGIADRQFSRSPEFKRLKQRVIDAIRKNRRNRKSDGWFEVPELEQEITAEKLAR